jgi:hypothetical protein
LNVSRVDEIEEAIGRLPVEDFRRIAAWIHEREQTQGDSKNASSSRLREREWLRLHGEEFAGLWIALDADLLIAQGSSAVVVLQQARAAGHEQPLVVHIPRDPELPFGGW